MVRCLCTINPSLCIQNLDANEVAIAHEGGLSPIIEGVKSDSIELQSQIARALRNLSVNREFSIHWCHFHALHNWRVF